MVVIETSEIANNPNNRYSNHPPGWFFYKKTASLALDLAFLVLYTKPEFSQ